MKGVLICGGLGTRLYPLTRTINKQLMPVYNQPLFYFPLKTLISAGIKEVIIISASGHAGQFLEHLGDNKEFDQIRFEYAIQKSPVAGIADALSYAENFAGGEKVAVILGDNIYEDDLGKEIANFEKSKSGSKIFFKEVADPQRFGCPEIGHQGELLRIIEKPKEPPSNLCVTGLYLYDTNVWNYLKKLKPSDRGQLEITELNNFYVMAKTMEYYTLSGEWIDAGTFDSLLEANIMIAKKNGVDVSKFI